MHIASSISFDAARSLRSAGLSPIPIQHASKEAFGRWRHLQVCRIHPDYYERIFCGEMKVNIAVMAGKVSGNLFVLDADSPEVFDKIRRELETRSLRTWERSSPRGGQFWFRCADGEVQNQSSEKLEIIGHDRYVLAPPSIHPRTGEVLEWATTQPALSPLVVSISELDWLRLSLRSRAASLEENSGNRTVGLPPVAHRVLVERDTSRYGGDNSAAEFAACLSMIGAGFSDDNILEIITHHQPPHFARVGANNFVRSTIRTARVRHEAENNRGDRPRSSTCATDPAHIADAMLSYVSTLSWSGASGTTDRVVLGALCERVRRDRSLTFRATAREVGLLANKTKDTASNSLRRLIESDWIVRVDTDARSGAMLYRFAPPRVIDALRSVSSTGEPVATTDTPVPVRYPHVGTTVSFAATATVAEVAATGARYNGDLSNDLWHRSACGASGAVVHDYLMRTGGGETVAEVARGMGGTPCYNTIKRVLPLLAKAGMATESTGQSGRQVWHGTSMEKTDQSIAAYEVFDTFGSTAKRREQYEEQRQRRAGELVLTAMRRHSSPECGGVSSL